MHKDNKYSSLIIRELRDQQSKYAPREVKLKQASRAEQLLAEIEPARVYPYEFLCDRLTDFRPDSDPSKTVVGSHVQHDLPLLIEDLTESANLRVGELDEPVWTVEELAERLNVSTKTIARWRQQGLVSRKILFDQPAGCDSCGSSQEPASEASEELPQEFTTDESTTDEFATDESGTDESGTDESGTNESGTDESGTGLLNQATADSSVADQQQTANLAEADPQEQSKAKKPKKQVGFLESSVQRFVNQNMERVERGRRFSQLTEGEKEAIITRARRLAAAGGCPSEVTKRLARKTNRSVETIRYTLKQYEEENPHAPIFSGKVGPLSEIAREEICDMFQEGISAEELARLHCRTKTSIYRIINEVRARRLLDRHIEYIDSEEFRAPGAERTILAPTPQPEQPQRRTRPSAGLPSHLASLYDVPLLTREQEAHLFRKMNFLKYQALQRRQELDIQRPKATLIDQIEKDLEEAERTRNDIISANRRLVVSIAKRHHGMHIPFEELVSDGELSLMRAVEKFDYSRGNKFSTYATWAIMKNFARSIPDDHKRRARYRNVQEELFEATADDRSDQYEQEAAQHRREQDISRILEWLDDREQQIIISRFGLDHRQEPLTLKEVGQQMGVTKERVRQIESRALSKLKKAAQEERIELPG